MSWTREEMAASEMTWAKRIEKKITRGAPPPVDPPSSEQLTTRGAPPPVDPPNSVDPPSSGAVGSDLR